MKFTDICYRNIHLDSKLLNTVQFIRIVHTCWRCKFIFVSTDLEQVITA
jgi:hypothetical protein